MSQFQPCQHGVAVGLWCACAQQQQDLAGGLGGRELPAGFVAQRQSLSFQKGADAARQRPVGIDQRNRSLLAASSALHAGGSALRQILEMAGMVQLHGRQGGAACGMRVIAGFDQHFQHACGLRVLRGQQAVQADSQRVMLQALQHDQRLGFSGVDLFKKNVGGIRRVAGPGQRQRGYLLFVFRRLHVVAPQGLLHACSPGHALRGRLRSGNGRELECGFAHTRGQPLRLYGQTCPLQKGLRGQQIHRGVE